MKQLHVFAFTSGPSGTQRTTTHGISLSATFRIVILLVAAIAYYYSAGAQTMADITMGTSNQDKGFVNLALRKQFSEKFRAGIELRTGLADYRFIGAKRIDEGTSTTLSIPVSLRIYEYKKLRLDLYSRIGYRFQAVSEEYKNSQKLESNNSSAFIIEPGLAATLAINDKLNLQSGVSFPNLFELSPIFVFENNITNLFLNINQEISRKTILLLKFNAGPAAGGDGDTQKFTWSAQAGMRLAFGRSDKGKRIIPDPSF